MSTTTSITLTQSSPGPCSSCAQQARALAEAHAQIEELESQIRILTLRATSAVEKATEYETSLRRLNSTRSHVGRQSVDSTGSTRPHSIQTSLITPVSPPRTAAGRLARLLPSRTASATPTHAPSAPIPTPLSVAALDLPIELSASALNSPSPSELELIEALSHEHELRKAAEDAAAKTNSEIEELTGQLFEQANESE